MCLSARCEIHDEKIVNQPEPLTAPSTTFASKAHEPVGAVHRAAHDRGVVELVHVVLVREHAVRRGEAPLQAVGDLRPRT